MTDEEKPPAHREEKPRVVEAEVVGPGGSGPRPPWWKRLLARAAVSLLLAALGLIAILIGAVLTVTVVGAWIGLPLLFIGLLLLAIAFLAAFGGGKVRVSRFPRGKDR